MPFGGESAERWQLVADIAFRDDTRRNPAIHARIRLRRMYRALEAACDAVAWLCGLAAAAWVTRDLAGSGVTLAVAARAALAVGGMSVTTGLLAGLYRGRYQRGGFDELIGIGRAAGPMALALVVLGGDIVPGQRAGLHTVVGGTVFALLAMAGTRHLVTASRQWSRLSPAAGVKVIIFGAGTSGAQLVHGLAHQPGGGYLPVALLDSDQFVLADIRDADSIRQVFERRRPQIVFHAAALKHLTLLERYPAEALKSNAWGTLAVLEAAADCGVESFVNISTDKAADPVSVLGYSKRVAEGLTAHTARRATGRYLSVRFGNVLGSRGSFLTALSAQAASGGPLTVTHPQVSRYFMTAAEAVQLVLQAAVIGRDGEVLVLDMGEQIRIADIARRLAASTPGQVDIVFTGLRPGEKLAESLLGDGETGEGLHHPQIRHVPVPPLSPECVTGLDPGLPADELRAALARCASLLGPDSGRPSQPGDLIKATMPSPRQARQAV